ncbi:DUF1289 domain-containing protein [Algiphilus aromaticivorans]|jgi:hypothetical protein|uniref:DUF1289 domain-containing protein n=1 Tax=Algiphilus aromaticivorans TaxID=382454 RepID=UPI0005C211BE|nr:DUF1289 domain-containing protein [Algiphilus aromaticivorans]
MTDAPTLLTRSPCTGVCSYNKRDVCKGCRRSRTEVKQWKRLGAMVRHEINLRALANGGKKVRRKLLKPFRD